MLHRIWLTLALWRCIICLLAQTISSSSSRTSKRLTEAFLDTSFWRPSCSRDGLLRCCDGIASRFDIAARLGGYSIFLGLTLRSPAKRVISEVRPISDFIQRPCPDRQICEATYMKPARTMWMANETLCFLCLPYSILLDCVCCDQTKCCS